MEENRLKRYRDKLNIIRKRKKEIKEWIKGFSVENFLTDEKTKLAVYKAFQEIVEAEMDILAMICKDSKIPPKDDYTNIEMLEKEKIIDENLKKLLIRSNGLRNRIVHLYNEIDDVFAFESIKEIIEDDKFSHTVKKWIKKKLKK